jgi:hypothetical protein
MTKELKTIDLNLLPIETLKEMANETAEQVENNAKLTVQKAIDCGRYRTNRLQLRWHMECKFGF